MGVKISGFELETLEECQRETTGKKMRAFSDVQNDMKKYIF